jgi:hypothetical protein
VNEAPRELMMRHAPPVIHAKQLSFFLLFFEFEFFAHHSAFPLGRAQIPRSSFSSFLSTIHSQQCIRITEHLSCSIGSMLHVYHLVCSLAAAYFVMVPCKHDHGGFLWAFLLVLLWMAPAIVSIPMSCDLVQSRHSNLNGIGVFAGRDFVRNEGM